MVDGRVEELHNEPPLTLKCLPRAGALELLLVGSAASLLEGDDLTIDISVSGHLPVVVRSVAAQVAHPCPNGGSTAQTVHLRGSNGARLFWTVEPLIVAAEGRHQNTFTVDMDHTSRTVAKDTVVLGRSSEEPSAVSVRTRLSAVHGNVLVLEDGLDTRLRGSHGPAGLNGNRVIANAVAVGWTPSPSAGSLPLAGGGALHRSLSVDAASAGDGVASAAQRWWHEAIGCDFVAGG